MAYKFYTRPFLGLLTANMFFWMSTNFFLPVLPLYYHQLGMDDHQVGVAVGAYSIGAVLFRVFSGKAVDKYGSFPVISTGIIVSIFAIISYYYANTLMTATLARFMHGVGITGYSAAALTMATLMHDEAHTTEAVSMYTLFTMFGAGIAASSAGWMYNSGSFVWVIAAGAVATTLSLVLFPKKVQFKIKPKASETLPLKEVVGNPAVYIPTVGLFAANICYGCIMTYLPLLMLSRGITEFSSFYIAYAVAVICARIWVGKLCIMLSPERLALYLLLIFAATMLILGHYTAWWVLVVGGLGLGIAYGLAFPTMATTITNNTQPANRGTAFGFYTMAVDVGFAAGAIGMGFVAGLWGYQAVFIVAGIYTLLYACVYKFWLWGKLLHIVEEQTAH